MIISPHNTCTLQEFLQFREGTKGLYKKQKRQNWDHKAYLMHLVLYNVHVTLFTIIALGASDTPCDPNLVSSAFYTIPIFPSFTCLISFFMTAFTRHRPNVNALILTRVNKTIMVHIKLPRSKTYSLSLFHCVLLLQPAPIPMYVHVHMHTYGSLYV